MKLTITSGISTNLELSLDGREYFQADELNITDREVIENAMKLIVTHLSKGDDKLTVTDLTNESNLYLRLNNAQADNYNDNLHLQKSLYESLTKKEKTILCFLGRGHKQKQTSFVLQIKYSTLRVHQKNIYKKMKFHNKVQLAIWCDKYLSQFFRSC